ncbi:protein GVQW3-like [Odontomachus brunneus]|uniref:protein GVQW3-like n=1 Tax=Odontomachus brunneus TaxID=486640 RepID=UPI0013F22229|nr:protein GVQW3-like [Odontomachus brunneus]
MLQKAFCESALSKTRAYEWYKDFKSGRIVVEDLPRSGRPSTSNTDENVKKVKEMVLENRHTSLREMSSELGIAYGTAQHIVVDVLGMRRVAARLVPKDLNFVQKHHRKTVAEEMISEAQSTGISPLMIFNVSSAKYGIARLTDPSPGNVDSENGRKSIVLYG